MKVQKLFAEPKRVIEKYAVGDGGDNTRKHMVALNWVLSDTPLDTETELALGFLDHLMLGTPGSPLQKALMESGLGEAMIGGGIEDELRQPQFSIGLKGTYLPPQMYGFCHLVFPTLFFCLFFREIRKM